MTFLSSVAPRPPRQRYVWPEKALNLVRSTRIAKKDGVTVVKQLQEITLYPEKVCWRLAEKHGFRRPRCRREWSQDDIDKILRMCESDRPLTEIANYFGTTVKAIHQKIIKNGKTAGRKGSIYTLSLISAVLRVTRATVRQWESEGRIKLKAEQRGSVTVHYLQDEDFEHFCRRNQSYLIFEVGGRIAPRERIQFLKEFVVAADIPDDYSARSHKRERHAYKQQMQSDTENNLLSADEGEGEQ